MREAADNSHNLTYQRIISEQTSSNRIYNTCVNQTSPVCGKVSFTNTKRALPGVRRSLLLKTWMNCPTDMSRGTRNLLSNYNEKHMMENIKKDKLVLKKANKNTKKHGKTIYPIFINKTLRSLLSKSSIRVCRKCKP